LTVPALVNNYSQHTIAHSIYTGWSGHAILKFDPFAEFSNACWTWIPLNPYEVLLLDAMRRMHEQVSETTIIGKQKQTLRIHVQSSHGKYADSVRNKVQYRGSPLGVAGGSYVALGLIEQVIDRTRSGRNELAIHSYLLSVRIDAAS
jgi:hypothetical protein